MNATVLTKTQQTSTNRLNDKHYRECSTERGLDPTWITANCRTVTASEASELLGYIAKSGGVWLEGDNFVGQLRPDNKWRNENKPKEKAPRYRNPLGEYDASLPNNPHNPEYWKNLDELAKICYIIDGCPCLVITEGLFKAIAGCSNEIPTISIPGVEQGLTPSKNDPQGKRFLVEVLEKFARASFGFILAFDADSITNKNVCWAQLKLAHQLKKFDVPIYSVTGLWSQEEGKGMDDYIQNNGADAFRTNVLAKAQTIETWEKQFKDSLPANQKNQNPTIDVLGREIAEKYGERLIYNNQHSIWMEYGLERQGVWTPVSNKYIESSVYRLIEKKGITGIKSSRYITNTKDILLYKLFERTWSENADLLPFTDGIYNLKTNQFLEHSPSHRLTWCLPRNFHTKDNENGWDTINNWLDQSIKTPRDKEILIHFAAAILRGRCDLQKFLHLIGPGGTGKSTYMTLLSDLIGEKNTWNGSIEQLNDKHEVARLIGKRLVLFPDQDKVGKKLSNFKRMTGQDNLSGRKLYQDGVDFRFPGLAVVGSNKSIFHGMGSWLNRRALMVLFNNVPQTTRDLRKEFEPELSAFTKYLMSISNDAITRVLKGIGKKLNLTLWESAIRTDSIAAWVNEHVVYEETAATQIGSDREEWGSGDYDPTISTLFGSYSLYCRKSGLQAKGKNNFSGDLVELCQQVLGWEVDYHRKSGTGKRCIKGLRLKFTGEQHLSIEEELSKFSKEQQFSIKEDLSTVTKEQEFSIKEDLQTVTKDQNFSIKEELSTVTTECHSSDLNCDNPEFPLHKECDSCDNLPIQKFSQESYQPNVNCEEQVINEKFSPPSCHEVVQSDPGRGFGDFERSSQQVTQGSSQESGENQTIPNTPETQTLQQRIVEVWDNKYELGKLVLAVSESELIAETANYTPEQIKHIKDAANRAWQVGLNRDAEYNGERVEIMEARSGSREVRVRTQGGSLLKVKRGNLRPWLGL